jgi:S-methylmethionine-dependent homocysteine/selenocysteine methylase
VPTTTIGFYGDAVSFPEPDGAVLVSDGGLATELEARGHDLTDSLWSARLLVDAPEEVMAAHLAFFRAGAQIATTGARIVGGCCRVRPAGIAEIARAVAGR